MPLPPPTTGEQDFSFTDLRGVPNGVTARVSRGYSVRTASLPPNMPAIPGGAPNVPESERIVENIKVTDPNNALVAQFAAAAPLKLFVRYSRSDVSRAGGDKLNLKLFYFDGSRWNQFTGVQFVDDPVGNSPGYARVEITTHWTADPPVGWSP